MPVKTTSWDSAKYLRSDEDIAGYIDAVLEEGDPALVAHAIGVVAKAKGMKQIADATGVTREGLYKSLSKEGNPSFATVYQILKALGIRLHAEPVLRT
ncbi:MAG TPA: addiction module antidote protein [Beijerinckiaceae bacterium]|nr:addiction module antidote protein [Beijerinckiaceae bacterium]